MDYIDQVTVAPGEHCYSSNKGSSGRRIVIDGWMISLPEISHITVISPEGYGVKSLGLAAQATISSIATTSDMVEKIKSVFGLNLTQIAKMAGVSRATIYNHLDSEISGNNIEVYQDLYILANNVFDKYGDVSNGLKSVLVDGKTLLKHLQIKPLEKHYIFDVLDQIVSEIPEKTQVELSYLDQRKAVIASNTIG